MTSKKAVADLIAADNKAIGFDFQYYYFLWRLIGLRQGERVGLEVRDDVHIEFSDGTQTLVQLKHSVQTKAGGDIVNLTTRDSDLWKTISNWCKMVCDVNEGRQLMKDQNTFLERTNKFIFVTNKSSDPGNTFISHIKQFQERQIDSSQMQEHIEGIKRETKDADIVAHIDALLCLKTAIRHKFLKKIEFGLSEADLITLCKSAIKEGCMIPEERVDDVFMSLDSQIRADNYYTIRAGTKVSFTREEFYRKYRKHFDKGRTAPLLVRPYTGALPAKLQEQLFVRQLFDISDVSSDDIDSLAEFTRCKLQLQNNVDRWLQDGELTRDEFIEFESDAKAKWKNEFRATYREAFCDGEEMRKARTLLDTMRRKELSLAGLTLATEISNGEYYYLSDKPCIGWLRDWEEKYRNGE